MNLSQPKSLTVPEIALIAATRGAIGFGAGLLLAGKFRREQRQLLGWTLFLSGSPARFQSLFGYLENERRKIGTRIRFRGSVEE